MTIVPCAHRSPRADQDGDGKTEMYLVISDHSCSGSSIEPLGDVRIIQNHAVPNDGIVKSLGEGENDCPAVAVWRVAWKLVTRRLHTRDDSGPTPLLNVAPPEIFELLRRHS